MKKSKNSYSRSKMPECVLLQENNQKQQKGDYNDTAQ